MNIMVKEEGNGYSVTCHAVVPGQDAGYEASARYVRRFFEILANHLRSGNKQKTDLARTEMNMMDFVFTEIHELE